MNNNNNNHEEEEEPQLGKNSTPYHLYTPVDLHTYIYVILSYPIISYPISQEQVVWW